MINRFSLEPHDTVEHAIEGLARWTGVPVLLEDARFRVVAYSSHPNLELVDKARTNTVLEKRAPECVLAAMRDRGILRRLRTLEAPARIPAMPEVDLDQRLVVPIREGTRVYGYLWLEDSKRNLASDDVGTIMSFARENVLPLLVELQGNRNGECDLANLFLQQLLYGHIPAPETATRIQHEYFPFSVGTFRLLALRGDGLSAEIVRQEGFADGTAIRNGVGHILTDLNEVVYILCALLQESETESRNRSDGETTFTSLTHFADEIRTGLTPRMQNFGIGLSDAFVDFKQIPAAAAMASRATSIATGFFGGNQIVFVTQYPFVTAAMPSRAGEPEGGRAMRQPAKWLRRLCDYDRRNETSLLHTLETYLDHGQTANQVASLLHVHPNTLHYRVRRIQELTGIDLSNGVERTLVHMELKMWTAFQHNQ